MKKSLCIEKGLRLMVLCIMCCVMLVSVVYASSTYASVTISVTDSVVSSNAVGLGTEASFFGYNNTNSLGSLTVEGRACWDGWPYTTEVSTSLKPGQSSTRNDTQSRSSAFKVRLSNNIDRPCNGRGSVTLKQ